jgi:hypothetical protein
MKYNLVMFKTILMNHITKKILIAFSFLSLYYNLHAQSNTGWISLFDGKTLNGWKVGDNASTFSVDSGMIKVNGNTAHLFYLGPVSNHNFKNFELKVDVMTKPHSNSGIYFHTAFQQSSWPDIGYEVQVNNSHTDWRRTGSLYGIDDVKEVVVPDNVWFTEYIKIEGNHVIVKINDKTVVDYTQPGDVPPPDKKGPIDSSGTFALQGHDPGSTVYFKNIMVRPLVN